MVSSGVGVGVGVAVGVGLSPCWRGAGCSLWAKTVVENRLNTIIKTDKNERVIAILVLCLSPVKIDSLLPGYKWIYQCRDAVIKIRYEGRAVHAAVKKRQEGQ
jgi:hypothetical protein